MDGSDSSSRSAQATALHSLLDATNAPVFLSDVSGYLVAANRGLAQRLRRPPETLPGLLLLDLLPPDSAVRWAASLRQAVSSGNTVHYVDRYDGAHFDTLCIPLRDGAGPVTAVAVFSHEITGLKLAEEALRESEERYRALAEENSRLLAQARQDAESKSILLQEVNHRVKNNLSAILGILELELGRPAGAPADFHKMLEALGLRIRGLAMVHDILTASAWLPVRLDGLLSTIIHGALVTLPAGKEITVSVEGDTLPLWVVPKQATALALIANELATNSIKYAFTDRTDGRISVSIRQETDATVTLEYRDDGPGWPPVVLSGSGESIGLRLIRLNARSPLRGALDLSNDGGAVARLRFALNPPADTTSAKGPA